MEVNGACQHRHKGDSKKSAGPELQSSHPFLYDPQGVFAVPDAERHKRKKELDFVRINPGTQRPESAIEVKWSDGPPCQTTYSLLRYSKLNRFAILA